MVIVSMDIETVNAEGTACYRWWRPGFRILSLALSWRTNEGEIDSFFTADVATIKQTILMMADKQPRLVVHNLAFEKGVFETLYPGLKFNWYADTMRMTQLDDNGGDWRDLVFNEDVLDAEASPDLGLSLEAAASRILDRDLHGHKEERDNCLRAMGIRSNYGSHIHLLPIDVLQRYNTADTNVTLELFEVLHKDLDGIWQNDWPLYYTRTDLMNQAYRRGTLIDLNSLSVLISQVDDEIDSIETEFKTRFDYDIFTWGRVFNESPQTFNVGSNKQLKELFVGVMGIKGKHLTEKGAKKVKDKELSLDDALDQYPSFRSKHLNDWGEGGLLLMKRRKHMLVLSQMLSTHWMATQGEGRIHPEIRVAGTRTNRVSGGRDE